MTHLSIKRAALPLLAVLALPLAGCETAGKGVGITNRSSDSLHQPVVSRTDYVFDVRGGPGGLSPAERDRLDGWFSSIGLGYGDRVAIDGDMGVTPGVERLLSRYGMLLADGAPVTAGPVTPGTARVVVSRSKASVPGCPDWSQTQEANMNDGLSSNYGCAVNGNLAAMVANPQDLVLGQPGSISRAPTEATKAIKTYQDKANTGAGDLKTLTAGGK